MALEIADRKVPEFLAYNSKVVTAVDDKNFFENYLYKIGK